MNDGPGQQLTAEEFAQLVWAATDQQIEEGIRAARTTEVLDRISSALPLAVRLNGFFDRPSH
jgi:transcriptional regulator with XRE-family HTH domain